jgi:tape measure domain-containing protein
MAKTVDELIVEIKADTKDLNAKLRNIEGTLGRTSQAGRGAFVPMIASVGRLIPLLGAVVAGLGSIAAVRGVAQVGSEFEDLRDSLNTVFGSINAGQGALNRILTFAQTTPFQIEDVSRAFIQLKGAGIEPSNDMLQTFADTASTSVDQLGAFQAMVRLVSRSAAGGLGLEEINQLDDRGIPATKILTEALGVTRLELSKFGQTAEGAAQMVDLLIAGMQQRFGGAMVEKMDNLSTKASNMTIAFKELGNTIFESGLGNFLGNLADKMNELASSLARMIRLRNNAFTAQDIAGTDATPEETTEILSQRIDETIKKMGTINRRRKLAEFTTLETDLGRFIQLQGESMEASLSEQVRLLPDFTDKTETATEAMGELDQVILEAGQNLSRDFANALLEGKNVLSSFSDFSKSIVSEIIATFIRLQVVEPILKGIFPTLGTDTTGTGSAGGGRASHGRPMLVGERGPELFVPHSAGNIMNNADTKSALGGGGISVVQNISFSTGVVPTVKAEITKMLPQIADVSKAAVLEANMRGGSFRRGMQ